MPPRIALVTARAARGLDDDMPPLLAALGSAGADAREVDWDDDAVEWEAFDLVLLRSTWGYFERLPRFLEWAARVAAQTLLLNPLDVIRWNSDKHYLADLARAAVPVVPTTFVEPGDDAATRVDRFLGDGRGTADAGVPPAIGTGLSRDIVVKPALGAGSRDAQRHARCHRDAIVAHVQRLLDARRSVLLQPYLDRVDEQGETALLFFEGSYSHAIRKGPLLKRGAAPVAGLFAIEDIGSRAPSNDELAAAHRAIAAIPFAQPLLYARVDLIQDQDGSPRVLELELVEPSIFAAHSNGAPERFVHAILRRSG